MSGFRLILKSLFHYRWINLSVLAGVALTSAILSGALVVGDSVKESLRQNAAARISGVGPILVGGERFFTETLASRTTENLGNDALVAPVLQIEGTASNRSDGKRVNRVQILGVDDRFWKLSNAGAAPSGFEEDRWFAINEPFAKRIGAGVDDTIIMRVELPGALSKDAPLSGESDQTTPFTVKVSAVLDADYFGLYSLRAEQIPPATLFVKLSRLQELLEQPGAINILLASEVEGFEAAVESAWDLDDLNLTVSEVGDGIEQIISSRVFLDEAIVAAAATVATEETGVLTYLTTDILHGERATPYSMVGGVGPQLNEIVDAAIVDDEIVISQWLADDLEAVTGDELTLVYDTVGTGRKLIEQRRAFRVAKILPLGEKGWDQSWTPEFPGIFDVDDLDDWEPGIPIDRSKIRDKDDEFWDKYKATPKAFVTLTAAREMWSNRFGDATAIRFTTGADETDLAERLKGSLTLSDLSMVYRDLKVESTDAVANSFDFGALFASMSFFLIAAALVLAGLVFVFGIEQRSSQIGLLLAMGFTKKAIRRLFLVEALILSVVGAALGLLGGYLYTRLALYGMSGAWKDAATGIDFVYSLRIETLIIAFLATVMIALLVVWFSSRRVSAIEPSRLISGEGGVDGSATGRSRFSIVGCIVSLLAGLGCLFAPKVPGTIAEQGMFFGAGFLFTIAGVFLCSIVIRRFLKPSDALSSLGALGRQHTVRRRGRSLAVIGLMAAGVFMVTAINSFRLDGERGSERRGSGTGGFAYVGESTLPIYEELNTEESREQFGLTSVEAGFEIFSMRVSNGDDASCLNLNRAQRPRLMGLDAGKFAALRPFSFTSLCDDSASSGWALLEQSQPPLADGTTVVPGLIDQNTAIYALQMAVGDHVLYETTAGKTFAVKIVGFLDTSILQGSLLISEAQFIDQFPDAGGYQFFLVDGGLSGDLEPLASRLTRMFGDRGLEMRPAADRLDEFNAVQNTYLSIFSTLGGLGILLGTVGLAIIVGRNVLERKGQLGVMQAMGFTRADLARMVLSEHWFLHALGVLIGLVAALIAVFPQLAKGGAGLPWGLLLGVNGAVLLGGLLFCWVAARTVVRGKMMESIRRE